MDIQEIAASLYERVRAFPFDPQVEIVGPMHLNFVWELHGEPHETITKTENGVWDMQARQIRRFVLDWKDEHPDVPSTLAVDLFIRLYSFRYDPATGEYSDEDQRVVTDMLKVSALPTS